MKLIFSISLGIILSFSASAQNDSPKEVTPEILKKIKIEVEKKVEKFRQTLSKDESVTKSLLEFQTDTFRINRINDASQEVDYSTPGISGAIYEMAKSYDILLNKYYNKLLKQLKGNDKNVLIKAQRAWLAYQKLEQDLIGTLSKEEYSGGGTIQSNIRASQYAELIIKRTAELFWYGNTESY
jgi:uncharacterized protein YecT (DUF1311 family)